MISTNLISITTKLHFSKLTDTNIKSILINYLNYYNNLIKNIDTEFPIEIPIPQDLSLPINPQLNESIINNDPNLLSWLQENLTSNNDLDPPHHTSIHSNITPSDFETFSNDILSEIDKHSNTELYDDSETETETEVMKQKIYVDKYSEPTNQESNYTTKRGRSTSKINYKV